MQWTHRTQGEYETYSLKWVLKLTHTAFKKEQPLRVAFNFLYLASNSMRSVLLIPSGISLGIAAIQVLNKSILGFLSPLQNQFKTNKTGKSRSVHYKYIQFHVKIKGLTKIFTINEITIHLPLLSQVKSKQL